MDFSEIRTWAAAVRDLPWAEIKSVAELVLYYLTIIAALMALMRIRAIGRIIRDFREARGPLWELQKTVSDLRTLAPSLRELRDEVALVDQKVDNARAQVEQVDRKVEATQQQVELVDEKVDVAREQVTELQVESISGRTDEDETNSESTAVVAARRSVPQAREEDDNWLILRDYWQRNRRRIEFVIEQIKDGRTKLAYDRLPRTNYTRIINKLQGQNLISVAAANASRDLVDLFNKYRSRKRPIPDEVVGPLKLLDEGLDRELVPFAVVEAVDNGEELPLAARPASPPSPIQPVVPIRPSSGDGQRPLGG